MESAGSDNGSEMVSINTLIEGVWFAMEQAGRLLRSAVHLYEAEDFGSAIALAMFAHEELGRSRILLDIANEVNQGRTIEAQELRKTCNDHLEKQRRGAFSLTYRGNQGEPLAEALHARMKCVPGSPEFDAAQTVIDQETDAIAKAQPSQRHTVRMSAVYLDLTSDGKSWNRPTVIDAQAAFERLNDASNDYSVGKQWFEEPLLSLDDDRLRALNPKTALLKMAKPAGLTLPPAKWPKMPA